jgi:hypothetical protein
LILHQAKTYERADFRAILIVGRLDRFNSRSPHWVKVKNPNAPAVKREAEEDWSR